jgi:hypothetical protein
MIIEPATQPPTTVSPALACTSIRLACLSLDFTVSTNHDYALYTHGLALSLVEFDLDGEEGGDSDEYNILGFAAF